MSNVDLDVMAAISTKIQSSTIRLPVNAVLVFHVATAEQYHQVADLIQSTKQYCGYSKAGDKYFSFFYSEETAFKAMLEYNGVVDSVSLEDVKEVLGIDLRQLTN